MKRETASARLCIFVAIESDPRVADTDAPVSSTNSFISEGQPAEWTAAPRAPCESELSGTSRAENRYLVAPLGPGFCRVPALVPAAWEVPMDAIFTLVTAVTVFGVATAAVFYVTGRAWRRRHTYVEDFWQRGGW